MEPDRQEIPERQEAKDRYEVYARLHDSPEFRELRHRFRRFVFPWTVAFLAWYLLYVVCANWATGFMNTVLFGNINVALVFGLLQFVSTFAIAWAYSRYANRELDEPANAINAEYRKEVVGS